MAKGLAITIVVASHVLQFNTHDYQQSIFFNWIRGFQMPLFMFLSGFVAAISRNKLTNKYGKSFFIKKIKSLLLPFVSWSFLIVPIFIKHLDFYSWIENLKKVVSSPDYGLWFLLSLFIIQSFFYISSCISNILKQKIRLSSLSSDIISAVIVLLFMYSSQKATIVMNNYWDGSIFYFPWQLAIAFYIGYFLKYYFEYILTYPLVVFFSVIVFAMISWRFPYTGLPLYFSIPNVLSVSIIVIFLCKIYSEYIYSKQKILNLLKYLGRSSLMVYCIHFQLVPLIPNFSFPLTYNGNLSFFLLLLGFSFLLAIVSARIADLLCKIPYLSLILFGKYKK